MDFFSAEITEGVKASVALEHVVTTVSGAKSKILMPNWHYIIGGHKLSLGRPYHHYTKLPNSLKLLIEMPR